MLCIPRIRNSVGLPVARSLWRAGVVLSAGTSHEQFPFPVPVRSKHETHTLRQDPIVVGKKGEKKIIARYLSIGHVLPSIL